MLSVGDVHIYVTDLAVALRFWADGFGLLVAEKEVTPHSGYARLDFPDGGPSLRLIGSVDPWPQGGRPELGTRPGYTFDLTTTDFDATLVRLIEHGGQQLDEIEAYRDLRLVSLADPDGNVFELLELPSDDFNEADEGGSDEEE